MVFVDRLSNVLSWAGFLCAIPFIVVVLIVASSSLIDNLVEKKTQLKWAIIQQK